MKTSDRPKCDTCGEPMGRGTANLGNGRPTHTWNTCPYAPHPDLRVEDRTGDDLGYVIVEYGDREWHPRLISVNKTRRQAELICKSLIKTGIFKTDAGAIVLPGDPTTKHEVIKRPKPKKRKKRAPKKTQAERTVQVANDQEWKNNILPGASENAKECVHLRVDELLSWAAIGKRLKPPVSAGKARGLWKEATGTSHTEAPDVKRQSKSTVDKTPRKPFFDDKFSNEEVEEYLEGSGTITVQTTYGHIESYRVRRLTGVDHDKGTVSFVDMDSKSRVAAIERIVGLG